MKKYLDKVMGFVLVGLILCSLTPITAFAGEENSLAAASNEAPLVAGVQSQPEPDADEREAATETETETEEAVAADPAEATEAEQVSPQTEEAIAADPAAATETPETEERVPSAAAEDGAEITAYGNLPEVATFETDQSIYAVYTVKGGHKVTFNVNEGPDATNETTITKTIGATKIGRLAPAPTNARKPTNPSDLDKFVPAPKPPDGYTFVGWSTSETERILFDVHQAEINESVELYAWFETGVVKVGTELELRSAVGYSTAPITVELTDDINLTDPLKKNTNADPDIYPAMNPDTQYAGYRQALLIAPGQDVTLTGNHSIAATVTADSGNTVLVRGNFTLDGPTITQIGAEGTIYGIETNVSVNDYDFSTDPVTLAPAPTVIFKSGNIHGFYMGIHVNNSHLEMEGGDIYNNGNGSTKSIGDGGGICVSGSETYAATAIISGGNIYNNTANTGGGVSVSGGKLASLTVSGGKIYDNHAAAYPVNGIIFGGDGGGISVVNPASSLTITGGNIYNNEADRYGGGVYSDWYAAPSMDISGGKIYENKAKYGGGLFSAKAPLNVSGGEIYQNDATYGGGIYGKVVNISDNAKIYENTATYGGGITTFSASELTMSGGEIYGNSATYGAGLFVDKDSNVAMSSGTVYDNKAATRGGGMYLNNADATVSGGTISGNTAANMGGGVLIAPEGSFAMSAGTFDGNAARFGGGIYNVGTVDLTGGKITNNSATNPADGENASGGGIYTDDYSKLTVSENVTFSGNIANKLTRLLETDEDFTTYREKISVPDGKWSVTGVKYGYNNYDINHLGSEYETVTVRFVAGSGGSLSGVTEYTGIVKGALFGEAVSVPSAQAAEGYAFERWSPALPGGGQAVTENATYTATFVKKSVTPPQTPSTPPATTTPTTPSPAQTPPPVAPPAQTARPVITAPAVTRTAPPMTEPDTQESLAPVDEAVFVEEPQTPADSSQSDAAWALINLILCVMGAILALITLIRMILRKKREEEVMSRKENGGRTQWLVVSVAMGLLGVIVFLLTENTKLPMIWVDKWTIVNLIIFAVGIAGALLTFKNKEDNDEGAEMSM